MRDPGQGHGDLLRGHESPHVDVAGEEPQPLGLVGTGEPRAQIGLLQGLPRSRLDRIMKLEAT